VIVAKVVASVVLAPALVLGAVVYTLLSPG
jgi:hypothetical protein